MAYVSLYRKYRSQTFGDLKGQDHVVRTLQNAIQTGRIAHAYLFTGPRGTGKTSSARLLAKCLCCRSGPATEPCNACDICEGITEGNCIDVNEFDAASESGVEDIREKIVQAVEYRPATARFRVFIIDEVHDLSSKAFDALLKTIEEPPEHIIFILATTEFGKVPPTIRSRCQKFEFHRATLQDLTSRMEYVAREESVDIEPAALAAIARMADGGYRDALTLLEQARLSSDGAITLENVYEQLGLVGEATADDLLLSIRGGKVEKILELSTELIRRGRDPVSILESLLYRLADLTRAAYGVETGDDAAREAALHEMAVKVGPKEILSIRSDLAEAHKVIREMSIPRLWLESEFIRISQRVSRPHPHSEAKAVVAEQPIQPSAPRAEPERAKTPVPELEKPAPVEPKPKAAEAKPKKAEAAPPAGSEAQTLWVRVHSSIPEGTAMSMKLSSAKAVDLTETEITLELPGLVAEWLTDKPERIGHIQKCFREAGHALKVNLRAIKSNKHPAPESSAVELPLEGKALHDAASEIMRGQS